MKKWIAIAAAAVVLVLIVVMMMSRSSKPKVGSDDDPSQPAFHPDSVIAFEWASGGAAKKLTRKSRDDAWDPPVPAEDVQARLLFLSFAHSRKIDEPGPALVTVKVHFPENKEAEGIWDGKVFVWTSGDQKGMGRDLNENALPLFQAGRYAFDNKKWNWCQRRIKKVVISAGKTTTALEQRGIDWYRTAEGKDTKIDPTAVEKWLGRSCEVHIDQFVDLSLVGENVEYPDQIQVEYEGSGGLNMQRRGKNEFLHAGRGLISDKLGDAMMEIDKFPAD